MNSRNFSRGTALSTRGRSLGMETFIGHLPGPLFTCFLTIFIDSPIAHNLVFTAFIHTQSSSLSPPIPRSPPATSHRWPQSLSLPTSPLLSRDTCGWQDNQRGRGPLGGKRGVGRGGGWGGGGLDGPLTSLSFHETPGLDGVLLAVNCLPHQSAFDGRTLSSSLGWWSDGCFIALSPW